jgi:fimbrial chaperone protein
MTMTTPRLSRAACAAALLAAVALAHAATAFAAASVIIWPINPVIEAGTRAAALWLENRGSTPVTLQVRVLGWEQNDFADRYHDEQQSVLASPPMATIAPGQRQLIRLTRTTDAGLTGETAYRVLID